MSKKVLFKAESYAPLNQKELHHIIPLIFLGSVFSMCVVTGILLGSYMFNFNVGFAVIPVSAGILLLPLTFLITDVISEVYGKKAATLIVAAGVLIQILPLLVIELAEFFPPYQDYDLSLHFQALFEMAPRMVLASIVAFMCSQYLDVIIYHKVRAQTGSRFLWIRNNASTMAAQLVDSLVFEFVFLYGWIPTDIIIYKALVLWAIKLAFAACDTPFAYLGVFALRRYLNPDRIVPNKEDEGGGDLGNKPLDQRGLSKQGTNSPSLP